MKSQNLHDEVTMRTTKSRGVRISTTNDEKLAFIAESFEVSANAAINIMIEETYDSLIADEEPTVPERSLFPIANAFSWLMSQLPSNNNGKLF